MEITNEEFKKIKNKIIILKNENEFLKKQNESLLKKYEEAKSALKAREEVFNPSKALTAITAEQAKIGSRGYFGDSVFDLRNAFRDNKIYKLNDINDDSCEYRFVNDYNTSFILFYPVD